MEELWWDDKGRLRTHAPSTYKIPTARDLPADFRVKLVAGRANPAATVFRSKAVGEPPFMLAISAWLALKDAVAAAAGTPHDIGHASGRVRVRQLVVIQVDAQHVKHKNTDIR